MSLFLILDIQFFWWRLIDRKTISTRIFPKNPKTARNPTNMVGVNKSCSRFVAFVKFNTFSHSASINYRSVDSVCISENFQRDIQIHAISVFKFSWNVISSRKVMVICLLWNSTHSHTHRKQLNSKWYLNFLLTILVIALL
jgi:hypothetical protein